MLLQINKVALQKYRSELYFSNYSSKNLKLNLPLAI